MATKTDAQTARFVLLPIRGFYSEEMRGIGKTNPVLAGVASARLGLLADDTAPRPTTMKIVDSVGETGPKLVEMGAAEIAAMRVSDPGVRAVPVVEYDLMRLPFLDIEVRATAEATVLAPKLPIRFVDRVTGKPVAGVTVVAFTDFAQRAGASGVSDASGRVALDLGSANARLDVLVGYPPPGYWGLGKKATTLAAGTVFELAPIDLAVPDYAAALYAGVAPNAGDGVTVGVIDTGVDSTHPDLRVEGGAVFVTRENDAGQPGPAATHGEHGTHVAGIIASTGAQIPQPPKTAPGKRGIAPGVRLFSYRVFANGGGGADNFDIIRAIDQGVKDKCDLLNLSLGSQQRDDAVEAAIKSAFDQGTLCIVAAGNDYRMNVSYPAAFDVSIAVSSAGRKGTYPDDSNEVIDEVAPFATSDPPVYISAFSNVGPAIDLTGPGEGIVSTLPGGLYGAMSGTSMAAPAVTGVAAALLSAHVAILNLPRDRDRSIAMLGMINQAAKPLGFDPVTLEGAGLPT